MRATIFVSSNENSMTITSELSSSFEIPAINYFLNIVSIHRMVVENRPVDPGSIQGSHRPISFIRIKHRTRANDILCKTEYKQSYRRFSSQNHIIRTCLMYHASCKLEFQPFKRSYSELTFLIFCNYTVFTTTTALYAGSVYHVLH